MAGRTLRRQPREFAAHSTSPHRVRPKHSLGGRGFVCSLPAMAERLRVEFGRGYSATNLAYMRTFYLVYCDRLPIVQSMIAQSSSDQVGRSLAGQWQIFQSVSGKLSSPKKFQSLTGKSGLPSKKELQQKLIDWAGEREAGHE